MTDELKRLREENERLRGAIMNIARLVEAATGMRVKVETELPEPGSLDDSGIVWPLTYTNCTCGSSEKCMKHTGKSDAK